MANSMGGSIIWVRTVLWAHLKRFGTRLRLVLMRVAQQQQQQQHSDRSTDSLMQDAEADELRQLTQRVCENVAAYVGAQLAGSLEEMQLLEMVVRNIDRKYSSMKREAESIGKLSKALKARATAMEEKMQAITDIDEELTELEDMVDQLDQYTGALETKFREVC